MNKYLEYLVSGREGRESYAKSAKEDKKLKNLVFL